MQILIAHRAGNMEHGAWWSGGNYVPGRDMAQMSRSAGVGAPSVPVLLLLVNE